MTGGARGLLAGYNFGEGGVDLPPFGEGYLADAHNPSLTVTPQGSPTVQVPRNTPPSATVYPGQPQPNVGGTGIAGFGGNSPFFGTGAPSGIYGPGAGPTVIPTFWGQSSGERAGATSWSNAPGMFSSFTPGNLFGTLASGFGGYGGGAAGAGLLGYGPQGQRQRN